MDEFITLAHGAGGRQTSDLIGNIFKKHFANPDFTPDDAAVLNIAADRIAVSTDGFVVSPWKFPGGNIGKLSICGTVNDIAVSGGIPEFLSNAVCSVTLVKYPFSISHTPRDTLPFSVNVFPN